MVLTDIPYNEIVENSTPESNFCEKTPTADLIESVLESVNRGK